jgi:hypothetical protein
LGNCAEGDHDYRYLPLLVQNFLLHAYLPKLGLHSDYDYPGDQGSLDVHDILHFTHPIVLLDLGGI